MPSINEMVTLLHDRLPEQYNRAFSLHFSINHDDFTHAKVAEVEWLGSQINLDEIKAVFPLEKINFHYGTAYLVYQSGKKEQL